MPQMEQGGRTRSENSVISNFISSLRLERTNTKVNGQSTVQRRKTLHKQAKDPKADQAALEKEIRHIERLASLLGRRPTKFDLQRSKPTVNHDLDSTLVGFFDVNDDDERLSEALLSGSHTARADDDEDGEERRFLESPELKAKNIHKAAKALITEQQTTADYASGDDPFDKIEEMNIANSPSGSAEYLPLDTYKSGDNVVSSSSGKPQPQVSDDLEKLGMNSDNVGGGKVYLYSGTKDGGGLDSPTCNDDILADINRSNTWKRQSTALIQERQLFGPALPKIADISDVEEDIYGDDVNGQLGLVGHTVAGADNGAGLLSTTSAVEEYLDILDYMDEKNQHDSHHSAGSNNDGHISSDLQGNSDSSDAGEISLSDGGECSSDSDSDASGSKYLARLTPQQPRGALRTSRKIGIGGDIQHARHGSFGRDGSNAESDGTSGSHSHSHSAQPNRQTHTPVAMPLSAGPGISGVPGRSTLRRGRRVLSKGKSLKSSLGPSARLARRLPAMQSAKSEGASTFASGSTPSSVADSPQPNSPDSSQRMEIASSKVVQTQLPGLAKLAEDAVAASKEMNSSARMKRQQPPATFYKPLPPIPDRIVRTLDASGSTAATGPGSGMEATSTGKIPPPLPEKARPTVPRVFAGERLTTRAEFEAENERPSAQRLFGEDRRPAEAVGRQYSTIVSMSSPTLPLSPDGIGGIQRPGTSLSAAIEEKLDGHTSSPLAEWLQRTDIMLPANNPAAIMVSLYPPTTGSSKSVTFNSYRYEPPAEDAKAQAGDNLRPGSVRTHKGRVVRRVSVLPPSQAPNAYQRPVSSSSSIYSSVSQNRNLSVHSNLNSPHDSKRASIASEHAQTSSAASSAARPQQNEEPASSSMENPASNARAEASATIDPFAFSTMVVSNGPTVLSAPPGAGEMFDEADASAPDGLLEPSAPMLPEPTAPELPQQWETSSPQTYAFPIPVHYVTAPPQGGYHVPPPPEATRVHGSPPELPSKPRPQSVPSAPLPVPPQSSSAQPPQVTHSQTAPYIAIEDVSSELPDAAGGANRSDAMSAALLSPTGGFVM
ncbi:hypothetical protein EV175_001400, partial [Coemansia sp. RSA 1933]